ncbi:DUF413 domain-containing protein [Reinekea blandensis]|uniref:Macrodomain Ori protein n=1 Tax=Reinekea blandensis MED297 TaxID=314283 RepID=A4BFW5_9GAMM|nr:DUF413 domain-containing protein [Reinekea blandensis]EAR08983.1 hypothetical protein MED297_03802 [Reinekea sp. MED297] [Reinekea blandensis MED297]
MAQDSFQSAKQFRDSKHFPYGFGRSGVFTTRQAMLLEKHGQAYDDLASGLRTPQTAEESQFLEFCQGQRTAQNDHEKIWLQYRQHIGRKTSYLSMEAGRGKSQPAMADYSDDDSWDDIS